MSKSPNHYNGRNGWRPDIIVCHITEGGFNGAVSWLCNPASKASAHFVVGAKGEVEQLVDLKDAAWCNGNSTNPTSRLYFKNALNAIVCSRKDNANYYTYSIEHEGYSYKDRYGALTEEQYQASLAVMKRIIQHMKEAYDITYKPDREHLIGHYEIDPKGKPNCPAPNKGKNFPFERFIRDLQAWMNVSSTPTQEDDFKPYTVRVATDSLNIRAGAGTGYKVVGAIKDKGIYTIVEQRFGTGALIWGKLKSGAGWIALDYTQKVNPASPTQDVFRPYLVKVTADTLNIRSGAGTNHKVVGAIKNKGVYTIVEEKTGTGATLWGKLKSGVGWVSLDFVTKV